MGGGGFLIEFPDNAEINLTPVKFDYISGAVLSCSPTVTPLFLSFLRPPLVHSPALCFCCSEQTLLIQITLSSGLSEAWDL